MSAPTWKVMVTGWSVPGILTSSPALVDQLHLRAHALGGGAARRFGSMTTSVDRPVTSSICLATVTPSSTFSNFTVPGVFGDDRSRKRVPHRQHRAGLDRLAVGGPAGSRHTAPCAARVRGRCRRWIMTSPEREIDDHLALGVGHVAHRRGEAHRAVGLGSPAALAPRRATPRRRCGRCASSAACPARRSTGRRSRRPPRRR